MAHVDKEAINVQLWKFIANGKLGEHNSWKQRTFRNMCCFALSDGDN